MANRLLTGLDILVELARLDDKTGAAAGYLVSDTMVLRKIDGKSVKYDTIDRLLSMEDFSSKFLKPLVCAPRKSDEIIGPTEIDDPEYSTLLKARGGTHGDYFAMSSTIQATKDVWRRGVNWDRLHSGQKEALELIATKIGRILTGDPGFEDHWVDGAGYFTKGAEVCAAYKPHKD